MDEVKNQEIIQVKSYGVAGSLQVKVVFKWFSRTVEYLYYHRLVIIRSISK